MSHLHHDTVDALKQVTSYDDDTVELLASVGRPINIPAGWPVIVENRPPDKAYILLEGEVEIRRDEHVIARLAAGDVVGEAALLTGHLRNATVVAMTPVRALHFTDVEFAHVVDADPHFAEQLRIASEGRFG